MTPFPTGRPAADLTPSAPRVIREIEHKFRVHGLFVLPDLTTLDSVGGTQDAGTEDVDSLYLDTADLRLIREGFALRRRSGGDDEGWHLKLPVAGADSSVHDELRLPLTDTDEPPAALTRLVHTVVRSAGLTEVARLRGRRHRLMIRDTANVDVAVLVDDTMEVLDRSGEVTARFRELELDPIAATETTGHVVNDVAKALNEAGALGGDFVAKVVRALGPRAAAAPEVPAVDLPDDLAGATVADVVAVTLSDTIRRFRTTDLSLRRDPDDPGAVHQTLVAAGRLRSAVHTYRTWLDGDRTRELITAVEKVEDVLGRLRTADVATQQILEGVGTSECSDATRDQVTSVLATRRTAARDDVLVMLESSAYLDLHEALVAAVQDALVTSRAESARALDTLPALLSPPWTTLSAQVDTLSGATTDRDWHQVRLAATNVQYAAEAVAPGIGADANRFAHGMADVTDLLGEHHDAVVAEQVATSVATMDTTSPEVESVLGRVAAELRVRADRATTRFPDVWRAAATPELVRWFDG